MRPYLHSCFCLSSVSSEQKCKLCTFLTVFPYISKKSFEDSSHDFSSTVLLLHKPLASYIFFKDFYFPNPSHVDLSFFNIPWFLIRSHMLLPPLLVVLTLFPPLVYSCYSFNVELTHRRGEIGELVP